MHTRRPAADDGGPMDRQTSSRPSQRMVLGQAGTPPVPMSVSDPTGGRYRYQAHGWTPHASRARSAAGGRVRGQKALRVQDAAQWLGACIGRYSQRLRGTRCRSVSLGALRMGSFKGPSVDTRSAAGATPKLLLSAYATC